MQINTTLILFAACCLVFLSTNWPDTFLGIYSFVTTNYTHSRRNHSFCNKARKSVVFQKIHKCSSSAVQNIVLRFAIKHKLNVALPKKGHFLGHKTSLFNPGFVQDPSMKFDVFCLHNRWNASAVKQIMVNNDDQKTPYFTFIREPLHLFT